MSLGVYNVKAPASLTRHTFRSKMHRGTHSRVGQLIRSDINGHGLWAPLVRCIYSGKEERDPLHECIVLSPEVNVHDGP